jgi:hypothetical protein
VPPLRASQLVAVPTAGAAEFVFVEFLSVLDLQQSLDSDRIGIRITAGMAPLCQGRTADCYGCHYS